MSEKLRYKECEECKDWDGCKSTCFDICGKPMDAWDEFNRYKKLEEQGLILPAPLHGVESFKMPGVGVFYLMPCMVGDDIYCIYHKEVEGRIEPYIAHDKVPSLEWLVTYRDRFGKTIFLTEEAAKARLEELQRE